MAFDFAWDFRGTAPFVTDPAYAVPALNEAFDIATTRLAVTRIHPPRIIYAMLALLAVLPVRVRFVAKKELFRYPFLGWHLRRSGQLPIDQDNPGRTGRYNLRSDNQMRSNDQSQHKYHHNN